MERRVNNACCISWVVVLGLVLVGGCTYEEREVPGSESDGQAFGVEEDDTLSSSDTMDLDGSIDTREGSPNVADVSSPNTDVSRPVPLDDVQSGLDVNASADGFEVDDVTVDIDSSVSGDAVPSVDAGDVVPSTEVEGSSEATVEYWADIFPTDCVDFRTKALPITQSTPDGVTNACVDDESQRIMAGLPEGIDAATEECGYNNLGRQQMGVCTLFCLVDRAGLSRPCSSCYALKYVCQIDNCLAPCVAAPDSAACARCNEERGCTARFDTCYGALSDE